MIYKPLPCLNCGAPVIIVTRAARRPRRGRPGRAPEEFVLERHQGGGWKVRVDGIMIRSKDGDYRMHTCAVRSQSNLRPSIGFRLDR